MNNQKPQFTKRERRELKQQEKEAWRAKQNLKRKARRFLSWAVGIALVVLTIWGLVYFARNSTPADSGKTSSLLSVKESDWVKGNSNASVTLIEYSDFQCPACGAYHPIVKQLVKEFNNQIIFVYRHFPLRQIHPNAELAARAAEAAGKQGKFWEMYDLIFENQRSWSNERNTKETFTNYAKSLGLDVGKFKSDLESKEVREKVDNDYKSGLALRVNATPTFFLNGQKLQNLRNYEEFKELIQTSIAQ